MASSKGTDNMHHCKLCGVHLITSAKWGNFTHSLAHLVGVVQLERAQWMSAGFLMADKKLPLRTI